MNGNDQKTTRVVPDWKQQFFDVKTIGPEPAMNRDGLWKKFKPQEIKIQGEKESVRSNQ